MNGRIKEIRKCLNLTQATFGERLGVTGTAIARIEKGERNLTEQMLLAICREFNVNENWLRTGEGEMFVQPSAFSLDEYAKAKGLADIERELIIAALEIPQEERLKFIERIREIMKNHQSETAAETTPPLYEKLSVKEQADLLRARADALEKGLAESTIGEKLA